MNYFYSLRTGDKGIFRQVNSGMGKSKTLLKGPVSIGIDIDTQSMRAARMRHGKPGYTNVGNPVIESLKEISGPFSTDEQTVKGLKKLQQQLSIGPNDAVAISISGKQVYAAQLMFRKLPDNEMKTALKFEIRKNLSFDTAGASIDYQFLAEPARKNDQAPVIVTAVSERQVQHQLQLFDKARIAPSVLEVFPLTVANAFLSDRSNLEKSDLGKIVLHIGSEYSTLVIEGTGIPFYTRTIYFAAETLFGHEPPPEMTPEEFVHRISTFTEDINRSLVYYESTFKTMTASVVTLLGGYHEPELLEKISGDTGLSVRRLDLAKQFEAEEQVPAGTFDIAIALALRGME